jgi:hypothetical protein
MTPDIGRLIVAGTLAPTPRRGAPERPFYPV